jgi:hypothetical protein
MQEFYEDYLCPLDSFSYRVTQDDILYFKECFMGDDKPTFYLIETIDGFFTVNKRDKILKVISRRYEYDPEFTDEYDIIDSNVIIMCKIATCSGLTYQLETKYSN